MRSLIVSLARRSAHFDRSWLWSGLILLGACFGTSTGNPIGDTDARPTGQDEPGPDEAGTGGVGGLGTGAAGSGNCHVVSAMEIAPDADSGLGFKASDVLAFVEGVHNEKLTWNPQQMFEYGPESGQHMLTLEIARKGAARLTHYAPDAGPFGEVALVSDGPGGGGSGCSDAIEIDVQVHAKTDQGALDETFDSTIIARNDKAVSIYHRVKDDKLSGSFAASNVSLPNAHLTQLTFSVQLTKYGTQGNFNGVLVQELAGTGAGAFANQAPIARWGLDDCLYRGAAVPMSAKAGAFSGDELLALLNHSAKGTITFDGSAASGATFAFTAASERACVVLDSNGATMGGLGTVYVQAALRIQSADGRIDGTWPLEVTARPDGSQIGEAQIAFDSNKLSWGGAFSQYGIQGFDTSAFDNVSAQLKMSASTQSGLSGDLTLTGFKNAACSTAVVMLPGGGMGVSGCAGATPTPLGHARIAASYAN